MINWKVRVKNRNFWITLIPALVVLIQYIASLFGFALNLSEINSKILDIINALFVVLSILGIVADPTTKGIGDSKQALTYSKPKGK